MKIKLGVFVSALAVAGALSIISSEGVAEAQGFVPYTNPAGGYMIMYPGNWEPREISVGFITLSPLDRPRDPFRENVNVVFENLPIPMTGQSYAIASLQSMGTQLQGFTILEQGPAVVAGMPGYYIVYQHFMQQPLTVIAFFQVRGTRGYVVTCTASPPDFMRYRPMFTQIAGTFRFM